jgi:uncharacterized protein
MMNLLRHTFLVLFLVFSFGNLIGQSISNDSTQIKIATKAELFWAMPPEPIGFINDYDHLYSKIEVKAIDKIITDYEKKTTVEICVVTIDSSLVLRENFDTLATHLLNIWGVGKSIKNNGILMLVCKEYRKIRISNGFGIEKILSNEETKLIIDNFFIPNFKKNEYYKGTLSGLKEIMKKLNQKFKLKK